MIYFNNMFHDKLHCFGQELFAYEIRKVHTIRDGI